MLLLSFVEYILLFFYFYYILCNKFIQKIGFIKSRIKKIQK